MIIQLRILVTIVPSFFHLTKRKLGKVEHIFLNLQAGLRVKWKTTPIMYEMDGTILGFCLDTETPSRCGIEVIIRWDDKCVQRYGANDFAKGGKIVVLEEQP